MRVIGIDPGSSSGCACMIDGDKIEFVRFSKNTEVDIINAIKSWVDSDTVCYLEKVSAMPGQGVSSTFKFGMNFGWLKGVVQSLSVPLILVRPQVWQKGLNLPKGVSKTEHKRNLKGVAQTISPAIKFTNDMTDAFLIARFGLIEESKLKG